MSKLEDLLLWFGLAVNPVSGAVWRGDHHRVWSQEAQTGTEEDSRGDVGVRGTTIPCVPVPSSSPSPSHARPMSVLRPVRVHSLSEELLLLCLCSDTGAWAVLAVAGGETAFVVVRFGDAVGSAPCVTGGNPGGVLLGYRASTVHVPNVDVDVSPAGEVGVATL